MMYRRYYQGNNQPDALPQRPIGRENEIREEERNGEGPSSVRAQNANPLPEAGKPEIVVPERPFEPEHMERKAFPELPAAEDARPSVSGKLSGLFGRFKKDDLLLIALIAILVLDGVDDGILIAVLILLFFAGL